MQTELEKQAMYRSILDGWEWEVRGIYACGSCDVPIGKCKGPSKPNCSLIGEWQPFKLGDKYYDECEYRRRGWTVWVNNNTIEYRILREHECPGDSKDWIIVNNNCKSKQECEEWIAENRITWLDEIEKFYGANAKIAVKKAFEELVTYARATEKKYGNITLYFLEDAISYLAGKNEV